LIDSLAVVCVYLYRSYLDVGIIIRTVLYCTCCWVDFDGNSKISSFNLHVYPSVYGSKCFGELQYMPPKGYAEGYHDNTCILPGPASATAAAASAGGGTGTGGKLPNYGTFGGFGCAPAAYIVLLSCSRTHARMHSNRQKPHAQSNQHRSVYIDMTYASARVRMRHVDICIASSSLKMNAVRAHADHHFINYA
jgi:hypothetical protein